VYFEKLTFTSLHSVCSNATFRSSELTVIERPLVKIAIIMQ
jgi:hypothetical protein